MEKNLKRISLMIREDQYEAINSAGINLSGLVRDLVDDHLSEHKIVVSVSEETRRLYEKIISNTGSTDEDVEIYFKEALKTMLKNKISEMGRLHEDAFGEKVSLK